MRRVIQRVRISSAVAAHLESPHPERGAFSSYQAQLRWLLLRFLGHFGFVHRALLQYGHRGQLISLQELEKCAPTGGDVRNPISDLELFDSSERFTAARNGECAARGNRFGN